MVQGAAHRQRSVFEGKLAVLAWHLGCRLGSTEGGEGENDGKTGELHLV